MSPFPRKKDKHLPPNVRYVDYEELRIKRNKNKIKRKQDKSKPTGGYYFKPRINGKKVSIFLAHEYARAMAKWAELTSSYSSNSLYMNTIFDRYMKEVAPLKAPRTYKDNIYQMARLREVFGEMEIIDILPTHIYRYLDKRGLEARVQANREKALLSHVFSMAIRWGLVTDNPCRHVKRLTEKPRSRYVEDAEFTTFCNTARPIVDAVLSFVYASARRKCEVLKINKRTDVTQEGIKVYDSKGKKWILLMWSDSLRVAYEKALSVTRSIGSIYLFANERGQCYTQTGFDSLFQKDMVKAIKEGVIKDRFTVHDVRAKRSSDAPTDEEACRLLAHSNMGITKRHYRRKMARIAT